MGQTGAKGDDDPDYANGHADPGVAGEPDCRRSGDLNGTQPDEPPLVGRRLAIIPGDLIFDALLRYVSASIVSRWIGSE
jgi:hypothetical protein